MPSTKRSSPKPTRARQRGSSSNYARIVRELRAARDPKRAEFVAGYFKSDKGEYGEGDRFLGIPVPVLRRIARRHVGLSFPDLSRLLASPIHEHRSVALEILVARYRRADGAERTRIVAFYLRHTRRMNNWDLVDAAAYHILGEHLKTRSRRLLNRLAASQNLWERRIAIVSTLALIRSGEIADTYRIARKLLRDPHDLIHKALGWALRETAKVSPAALLKFLQRHYSSLPRTTLRYAIERFPAVQRKRLLTGEFR